MNCTVTKSRYRKKFIVLCLWLLTGAALGAHARQSKPLPEIPVTIELKDATLARLLQQIEQLVPYTFTYNKLEADGVKMGNVNYKNIALSVILKNVAAKYKATFVLEGNNIAVQCMRQKGNVSGTVIDESTGNALASATVRIGDQSVATDASGAYSFVLPDGMYTLQVSSVGYQSKKLPEVIVRADNNLLINITLQSTSGKLQEVIVTSAVSRENVASLYSRQKNAPGITDGISAEQIARTPDKNIGESLKRISGLSTVDNKYVVVRGLGERYNGAILNGQLMPSTELNRKQFSFDIIPSNLVENVTVYKTLTPDLSAEFGGGLVAVNTQAIPAENFLTVSAGTSYNNKTTGKEFKGLQLDNNSYWAGTAAHRKLMGNNNWNSRTDIIKNFNPSLVNNNWQLYKYTPSPSTNYQLSGGKVIAFKNNQKLGVVASVSYRNTWQTQDIRMGRNGYDGYEEGVDSAKAERATFHGKRYGFTANLGALAGAGYTTNKHRISWQSIYLRTMDQQTILGLGSNDPVGRAVGFYDIVSQTTLLQNQLRGEHLLNKKGLKLNWTGSYLTMDRQKPDNHIFNAEYIGNGKDDPNGDVDFSIRRTIANTSKGALRSWTRAHEKDFGWNVDFTAPFNFQVLHTPIKNVFKVGYAGWSKERSFWVLNTGSGYNTGEFQPLTEYFEPSLHEDMEGISIDRFGDDFHRTAKLHAGYMMMDNKIGKKWRLVWGMRAEYYDLNNTNAVLDSLFAHINQSRGGDNKFDYSELLNREPNMNFFPSANIAYSLTPTMNLRLAYSKSIIRPDLREMSYFKEYDFELGGDYTSSTPVRSSIFHHYDFRYEWYPGPGEVMSFTLFYKKINYPMEIYKQGDNREFQLQNNKAAKNKGIEIEIRKTLAFTQCPIIKNITLFGNFTYIDARVLPMTINNNALDLANPLKITPVEVVGAEEKRPQSGASNYIFNAGVYYDIKPLSVSLSYNYVSNRMFRPSNTYRESLFEQPLNALDAQVAVNLLKRKIQVKCNIGNLLNGKAMVYRNMYTDADIISSKRAPTVKELLYQKGDAIDLEAKPGRTYGFTVSYRL